MVHGVDGHSDGRVDDGSVVNVDGVSDKVWILMIINCTL